jgi:hypothetical protein
MCDVTHIFMWFYPLFSHQLLVFLFVVSFVSEVIEKKAHKNVQDQTGNVSEVGIGKQLVYDQRQGERACHYIKDLKLRIHTNISGSINI